jgi:hypothetical protein
LEVSYDGKNFDVCNFIYSFRDMGNMGGVAEKYSRSNVTDKSITT